jgi:HAD superfamily hydrolase (TIGR01662 family)
MGRTVDYSVVIPTTGRPSLRTLLSALAEGSGPAPTEIIVVDDRPRADALSLPTMNIPVRVLRSGGKGPASARNRGWRAAASPWLAFLDDDVLPPPDWSDRLVDDVGGLPDDIGASQARIVVPLPADRRPTDFERGTAGLATARWITADMAYRRAALEAVSGFDERFPRAFREDADLALRVIAAGYRIVTGDRVTTHPVRPSGFLASLKAQRGNADDAFMRRRHGPDWRHRIGDGRGRMRLHALTTASGLCAVLFGLVGRRKAALAPSAVWAALTTEFALRRIMPGPRTTEETLRMAVTSVAIPPAACLHRALGEWHHRNVRPAGPAAVLFDRDGTLVHDVPYNGDPALVRPVDGARAVLRTLRRWGIPVGVVTNQSGIARGLITPDQMAAVNARVDRLLGPFDTWQVCPHGEYDGCDCRKPAPGLVKQAAAQLGVPVADCVVIGDTAADLAAADAAGARGILVPNMRTEPSEISSAREVAEDLRSAVDLILVGRPA